MGRGSSLLTMIDVGEDAPGSQPNVNNNNKTLTDRHTYVDGNQ